MSKNCPVMRRMKENYELPARYKLIKRVPVIIRIDGKAFSTYTRGLDKPFDTDLIEDMEQTAVYLCQEIQGAKCAYVQSDEISILVTDYDKLNTNAWFDYVKSKVETISASLTTGKFNQLRMYRFAEWQSEGGESTMTSEEIKNLSLAFVDSRAFNVPKEDVSNYFLARQRDAVKNSVASLAQSLYSHKELDQKSQSDMQEMIFERGQNWNNLPVNQKRGSFIVKNTYVNDEKVSVWPDLAFLPEQEGTLEFYPKNCREDITENKCRRYVPEEDSRDRWDTVEIEKIRTKWEVVDTPFKFDNGVFKKWLK